MCSDTGDVQCNCEPLSRVYRLPCPRTRSCASCQRGERIERSFAHLYDTGGMRRTYLRGHTNILKRLLIHAGGFNLGLVMRHLIGSGTPRGLQDRPATAIAALLVFLGALKLWLVAISAWHPLVAAVRWFALPITTTGNSSAPTTYTTGC